MARAYSPDLRERVIVAVASGQSRRRVATTFRVEPLTVVKWWRRYRSTGEVAARRRGGSKVQALVDERDWVLWRVAEPQYLRHRLGAVAASDPITPVVVNLNDGVGDRMRCAKLVDCASLTLE